jgi:hypothetical protein
MGFTPTISPEVMDKGAFVTSGLYGYTTSVAGGLKYTIGESELISNSITDTMMAIMEHARDNYNYLNHSCNLKEVVMPKDCATGEGERQFIFIVSGNASLSHTREDLGFSNWSASALLETTPVIVSPNPADPGNGILHLVCYRYYNDAGTDYVEDCQIVPVERDAPGTELTSTCIYAADDINDLTELQREWLTTINTDEYMGYAAGTLLITQFGWEPIGSGDITTMDRFGAKLYRISITLQYNALTWGRYIWYTDPSTGAIPPDANNLTDQPYAVVFVVPYLVKTFADLDDIGREMVPEAT